MARILGEIVDPLRTELTAETVGAATEFDEETALVAEGARGGWVLAGARVVWLSVTGEIVVLVVVIGDVDGIAVHSKAPTVEVVPTGQRVCELAPMAGTKYPDSAVLQLVLPSSG